MLNARNAEVRSRASCNTRTATSDVISETLSVERNVNRLLEKKDNRQPH